MCGARLTQRVGTTGSQPLEHSTRKEAEGTPRRDLKRPISGSEQMGGCAQGRKEMDEVDEGTTDSLDC